MLKINHSTHPLGELPTNYEEVLHWTVTENLIRNIGLQFLGVLVFIIFGVALFGLSIGLGWLPGVGSFSITAGDIGIILAGTVLTFVLHEVIHGIAMRAFGARPHYGVLWKGLMLYATAPEFTFLRNQYVVILLAPFIVISIVVILGMGLLSGTLWVVLLTLCGALNAGGAVGDIWITGIVLRYASTALFVDERDGIRVYCRINDHAPQSTLKVRITESTGTV